MGPIVSTLAFPNPPREYSADLVRTHHDLVWLTTARGLRIPALHLSREKASYRPTILYSHGNAEDLGIISSYLEALSSVTNCPVLAYEYPGYGIADGRCASERQCYDAIQAALEYLTNQQGLDLRQIVLFGRSLGSGPTVHLASHQSVLGGVILQSPLTSAIRCVLDECTATALWPIDIFTNHAKVHRITCPVLILHGEADTVVPVKHGHALYATLQQRLCLADGGVDYPPVWLPGRGHNDMPERYCMDKCRQFVNWLISDRRQK